MVNLANQGGSAADKMTVPQTVVAADGKLFAVEYDNNRVLIWNAIPATDGAPANVAVGQSDLVSNSSGCTGTQLLHPESIAVAGGKLIVADSDYNRILVWTSFPTVSFAPADVVLGQRDFTGSTANDDDGDGTLDPTPSARTFRSPDGLHVSGTRLFVADSENSRWLIFDAR